MKAPELVDFWFDDDEYLPAVAAGVDDDQEHEQRALDELVERVSAARLVY
jgi:hypothetical protein